MQFMASISFDTTRRAEVERLLPAEQLRVRELQHQGVLDALYVPDGSGATAGLWVVFNGESRDIVERVIESLPLYPYMLSVRAARRAPRRGAHALPRGATSRSAEENERFARIVAANAFLPTRD